jgi:periplasmic protein TonB
MSEKSPNGGSVNETTANDQAGSTAAFSPGDLLASWAAETDTSDAPAAAGTGAAAAPARPIEQKPAATTSTTSLKLRSHRALRMGISLPVEVQHPTGTREQSQTVFVLARGAVISVTNAVIVGQKLTLKNLKNSKVVECRVLSVERGLKGTMQAELEFTEVIPEFWPVKFPSEDYGQSEAHGRPIQSAPVSAPSVHSYADPKPGLTTHPAKHPTVPPINPSLDKPAISSKPVELVPLAGSLAGQKVEMTPAIASSAAQNKTPLPGTYSTSDVRAAELAASSIENKSAQRKTPVPGTHTINDFRRVEPAPSVEIKVRNTPVPGAYTATDVHAMDLKASGVELKVRNTPVPGTHSVNDFRSPEPTVTRHHSPATYSHTQHRRTESASSGSGMKWIVLCAAVVLIAAGVLLGPKFLHKPPSSAHVEAAPAPSPASAPTEKLTASEPTVTTTPEPSAPTAQASAPTIPVEEPVVETPKENKSEAKLEVKEAKSETRSESKSAPAASHQTSTKQQAKGSEQQHELAILKQSSAMSHKQAPVTDETAPAPVLSAGGSELVANSQPPEVLTGIVAPPSPVSAPRTVSHIKAPRLITATPPQYPAIAKQNRIQGDVIIEMDIDANGNVTGEKVLSGPPFLQAAAKDAVRRWKYEPATLNDNPIPYHMQVKVHFALQ